MVNGVISIYIILFGTKPVTLDGDGRMTSRLISGAASVMVRRRRVMVIVFVVVVLVRFDGVRDGNGDFDGHFDGIRDDLFDGVRDGLLDGVQHLLFDGHGVRTVDGHLDGVVDGLLDGVRDDLLDGHVDGVRAVDGHADWHVDVLLDGVRHFLLDVDRVRFLHVHRVRAVYRHFDGDGHFLDDGVRMGHGHLDGVRLGHGHGVRLWHVNGVRTVDGYGHFDGVRHGLGDLDGIRQGHALGYGLGGHVMLVVSLVTVAVVSGQVGGVTDRRSQHAGAVAGGVRGPVTVAVAGLEQAPLALGLVGGGGFRGLAVGRGLLDVGAQRTGAHREHREQRGFHRIGLICFLRFV